MRILNLGEIATTLLPELSDQPAHVAEQMHSTIADQVLLFTYAARPEMAVELGADEDRWYSLAADPQDDPRNEALLSATASMVVVVAKLVDAFPSVLPLTLMTLEQSLQPKLLELALTADANDQDLHHLLVDSCRQKDLLLFGLELVFAFKEATHNGPPPDAPHDVFAPNLRELLKLRVIVDAIDSTTEEPHRHANGDL